MFDLWRSKNASGINVLFLWAKRPRVRKHTWSWWAIQIWRFTHPHVGDQANIKTLIILCKATSDNRSAMVTISHDADRDKSFVWAANLDHCNINIGYDCGIFKCVFHCGDQDMKLEDMAKKQGCKLFILQVLWFIFSFLEGNNRLSCLVEQGSSEWKALSSVYRLLLLIHFVVSSDSKYSEPVNSLQNCSTSQQQTQQRKHFQNKNRHRLHTVYTTREMFNWLCVSSVFQVNLGIALLSGNVFFFKCDLTVDAQCLCTSVSVFNLYSNSFLFLMTSETWLNSLIPSVWGYNSQMVFSDRL